MPPIVILDNISAGYNGRARIRNISMTVGANEFVAIKGQNGSGKTTLLRVMTGLLKPMEGTVSYFRNGTRTDRLHIGYLPQVNAIDREFPISVEQTVMAGLNGSMPLAARIKDCHREAVAKALEATRTATLAKRPIKELSGGQMQRVLLARAIVSTPELLVLDEPDTYIDRNFEQLLWGIIDEMTSQCTVVVVTHSDIQRKPDQLIELKKEYYPELA